MLLAASFNVGNSQPNQIIKHWKSSTVLYLNVFEVYLAINENIQFFIQILLVKKFEYFTTEIKNWRGTQK